VPRAPHVLAELLWRHLVDMLVEEAFAGNLMTAPRDLGDYFGVMLGNPAENKECRLGADFIEKIEGRLRVPFNPALESRPVVRPYDPADRTYMAIVLKHYC